VIKADFLFFSKKRHKCGVRPRFIDVLLHYADVESDPIACIVAYKTNHNKHNYANLPSSSEQKEMIA
jgi:hypothetical protein